MVLELESDELRVVVAPRRGAELRFAGRPGGRNVLAYDDEASDSYVDFLTGYRGGWQELFPNPGAACTVHGDPLPFHGVVAGVAWTVERSTRTTAVLRTAPWRALVLERKMTIERGTLRLEERVTNDGDRPVPFAWGHHPAFAVSPGSSIDMPPGEVVSDPDLLSAAADLRPGASGDWPELPARDGRPIDLSTVPEGPAERLCYRPDVRDGWTALRDRTSGGGIALSWDPEAFPHVWLWQSTGAGITAIEPMSVWPADGLAAAVERGRAGFVAPGGMRRAWLTMTLFEGAERRVLAVDRHGRIAFGEEDA